jgi:hypothetical protein
VALPFIDVFIRLDVMNYMIRGTTAQFKFELPKELDVNEITSIEIRAWQNGYSGTTVAPLPIRRTFTNGDKEWDSITGEHVLIVQFTSSDTSRFTDKLKGYIQCKVNLDGQAVYGTLEQRFTVYPMHGELVGGGTDGADTSNEGWIILDGQTIIPDQVGDINE